MTPAIEVSDLTVRFGGVVALKNVSLAVKEGEIVGLIGPNGAGKTTLIDAMTGVSPYDGSVFLSGDCIDGLRSDQRAARGLGRTFQSLELFEDLTVRENASVSPGKSTSAVDAALDATGLSTSANRLPATLPPATRRLVALARALAAQPRVLLLDEIAAGLDREMRSAMASRLQEIVSAGASVVLVDHDLPFVTALSQRVIVLDAGRVIADAPPTEIGRNQEVLAAYLGRR